MSNAECPNDDCANEQEVEYLSFGRFEQKEGNADNEEERKLEDRPYKEKREGDEGESCDGGFTLFFEVP